MKVPGVPILLALVACSADPGAGDDVVDPIDAAVDAPACGTPRTIFLNRAGGTYTRAADDDASTNESRIVPSTITFPAPTVVEAEWTAFVACIRAKFEPFNVIVTEEDPGAAVHTELVVIDTSNQIGVANGVSGVSPFECDGGPVDFERGMPFLMWNVLRTTADRCWTGAQVLGNSFGLDHAFSCPDLMSYQTTCGPGDAKTFTDADVRCGELEARDCTCGGATQNSFRYLFARLRPACR